MYIQRNIPQTVEHRYQQCLPTDLSGKIASQLNDNGLILSEQPREISSLQSEEYILLKKAIYKRRLADTYARESGVDLSTAESIIMLSEIAGAFEEDYLNQTDLKVRTALAFTDLNISEEEYNNRYYSYFLQSILQTKFFNRDGKERWDVDIQNFVIPENIKEVVKVLNLMPEFFTKKIPNLENTLAVLGAALPTIIKRLIYAKIYSKDGAIISLTSDRPVFEKEIKNVILNNEVNNYRDLKSILANTKLTEEQRMFIEYSEHNIHIEEFKRKLENDEITEYLMGEVAADILNFKKEGITLHNIETKKSSLGLPRANTVDTVVTLLDSYDFDNTDSVTFISNQPHNSSQGAQIKSIFNKDRFNTLQDDIKIDENGNYIYMGTIIHNLELFKKNFEILVNKGFEIAGDGINLNYSENMPINERNILLTNMKLMIQNTAGAFHSYFTNKINKDVPNASKINEILKVKDVNKIPELLQPKTANITKNNNDAKKLYIWLNATDEIVEYFEGQPVLTKKVAVNNI